MAGTNWSHRSDRDPVTIRRKAPGTPHIHSAATSRPNYRPRAADRRATEGQRSFPFPSNIDRSRSAECRPETKHRNTDPSHNSPGTRPAGVYARSYSGFRPGCRAGQWNLFHSPAGHEALPNRRREEGILPQRPPRIVTGDPMDTFPFVRPMHNFPFVRPIYKFPLPIPINNFPFVRKRISPGGGVRSLSASSSGHKASFEMRCVLSNAFNAGPYSAY